MALSVRNCLLRGISKVELAPDLKLKSTSGDVGHHLLDSTGCKLYDSWFVLVNYALGIRDMSTLTRITKAIPQEVLGNVTKATIRHE
ncbi:hypothetical protein J6590_097989 [Homalodisca vitripennis]|nr:hypothetical protein J6590_097989 [Homalodisca vitripennis]